MESWAGPYCIYVSDLERSVASYQALGPVTLSFVADPDAYQVELVERHPD